MLKSTKQTSYNKIYPIKNPRCPEVVLGAVLKRLW